MVKKNFEVFLYPILVGIMLLLGGCGDRTPPAEPVISGVENGQVYGTPVVIQVSEEKGVKIDCEIDGMSYIPGTVYGQEGIHTLHVVAAKRNGLSVERYLVFEIDTQPPPEPDITGVEEGKVYNRGIAVDFYREEGVSYTALIDQELYISGSIYDMEGSHTLEVTAHKIRNGLTSTKRIRFEIDKGRYTRDEIDYFREIAFGSEFEGDFSGLRKWNKDRVGVKIFGDPTEEDRITLQEVIRDIGKITSGIRLELVQDDPDISVHFIPQRKFYRYTERDIAESNWGLFWYYSNDKGEIQEAMLLISTDEPNQLERNHLIREELTQALGLGNDSWKYESSIFYQGWSTVQEYSEIDKKLIQILYHPDIQPNMEKEEVVAYLENRLAHQNERERIFPIDEGGEREDFLQFRKDLMEAVKKRDPVFLIAHLDEGIRYKDFDGVGSEAFIRYWGLDTLAEESPVWEELEKLLVLGGVFKAEEKEEFIAPYLSVRFPYYMDPHRYGVILEKAVNLYKAPNVASEVLEVLNYDVVYWLSETPQEWSLESSSKKDGVWIPVATLSGKKGYVKQGVLRRPSDFRIAFVRKDGSWKIGDFSK
ncbi:MAG: DUF2927 domain-containing protein [Clostridia bacterium]|jgi:hypothetical protein